MDDVAEYNVGRWRALAAGGALYTRPMLDLDAAKARANGSTPTAGWAS
ncbi:MAG: hypothetical protein ABW208_13015 [Pyrinomonadaceae bacterium]